MLRTTGLLRKGLAPKDRSQPRICQLAAILFDMKWKPVGKLVTLIRPDSWAIEPDAQQHHGITEQQCASLGVPIVAALAMFQGLASNALQIFGHNVEFDRALIDGELARLGASATWWKRKSHQFADTMEVGTPILNLPGEFGVKFPTLEEVHRFLLPDRPYTTAHEGEADVMATARCAKAFEARGEWPKAQLRPATFERKKL